MKSAGFPCVRYGQLYTCYKTKFSTAISFISDELYLKCKKAQNQDILMSLTGENNFDIAMAVTYEGEKEIAIGGDMTKFTGYNIDPLYFTYVLNSSYGILCKSKLATGNIIVHISNDKLANILIPLPPLEEQKRIVAKIEELLPLVDDYAKSYEELEKLNAKFPEDIKKSILQYAIQGKLVKQRKEEGTGEKLYQQIQKEKQKLIKEGKIKKQKALPKISEDEIPFEIPENWKWVRMGECCEIYTGNSISESIKKTKYLGLKHGLDYIATKDVNFDTTINYDNGVRIPISDNFKVAKSESILMCVEGGSAGRKIGILDRDVCFGNKLCMFNSKLVFNRFIFYYLQSDGFKSNFTKNISGIIGGVSINKIKTLFIPLPPLDEQKRIVDRIEELLSLCKKLNIK